MSIKTDAVVIRDETTTGANTATRVGTNLVDIADDLVAKQAAIDLNTAKETNIAHPLVETAVPVGAVFTDNDTVYDDTAIQAEVDLNTAKVGITAQQASDIVTNNAKVGVTTEEANPDVVSQVEAEAGVATDERIWTAQRVKQAIDALAGGGAGVDDTAYGISWDGVTGIAPSKNALYDFIESQVFKVDASSNIVPIFWGGTQAEYDIDFPTGHDPEYFIVITDGAVSPTSASDIVNVPSGNLVATDVQGALDELQTEVDGLSGGGLVVGDIDTLAELNAIVTDATLIDTADARLSDARTPTAHTHTASEVTDFDTEVSNNASVTANTAKVTNATHTGDASGDTSLTLNSTAISGKGANAGLAGTEEVLINNAGTLEKTTTQDIADLGGGGGVLQEASIIIINPTISGGVFTTELVASQGAGKMIIITSISMVCVGGVAPTTSVSGHIRYNGDAAELGSGTLLVSNGVSNFNIGFVNTNFFNATTHENVGLDAYLVSTTDEALTGNFHFHVTYKEFDTTTGF